MRRDFFQAAFIALLSSGVEGFKTRRSSLTSRPRPQLCRPLFSFAPEKQLADSPASDEKERNVMRLASGSLGGLEEVYLDQQTLNSPLYQNSSMQDFFDNNGEPKLSLINSEGTRGGTAAPGAEGMGDPEGGGPSTQGVAAAPGAPPGFLGLSGAEWGQLVRTATDAAAISVALVYPLALLVSYNALGMRGWTPAEMAVWLPGDSLRLYSANTAGHPATTALLTSMTSYFLGDVLAQVITDGARPGRFDRLRGLRWASAGALVHASLSSLYFPLSDRAAEAAVGADPSAAKMAFQIWIDNTIYFPVLTLALFVYLAAAAEGPGAGLRGGWAAFRAKLVPLGTRAWRFWPLADLLTFGPVPPPFRLLYVSTVRIVWVAIQSSYVARSAQIEKTLEERKTEPIADSQNHSSLETTKKIDEHFEGLLEQAKEPTIWERPPFSLIPSADSPEAFYAFMAYFAASSALCLYYLAQ